MEDKFEVPQWVKQEDIMYTRIFTDSPPLSACSFFITVISVLALQSSWRGKQSHVNVWSRISLHIALELNINILLRILFSMHHSFIFRHSFFFFKWT